MIWAFIPLLAAILFTATNFIDKYFLSRFNEKINELGYLALAGLAGIPFLFAIGIYVETFTNATIAPWTDSINKLISILAGCFFSIAFGLYIHAITRSHTSTAASLFQLTVIWNVFLGWTVLSEKLTITTLIAAFLLVGATFYLSHEIDEEGRRRFRKNIFSLMVLASLMMSISDTLFKITINNGQSYFVSQFYDYLATIAVGIIIIIVRKRIRIQLKVMLIGSTTVVISLAFMNEAIALLGNSLARLSISNLPIAIAQGIMGAQPLLLILAGFVLSFAFPERFKEKVRKRHLYEKICAALVIILAEILLIRNIT